MKWTDFFSAIYCINLPESKERREAVWAEFKKFDIPASIWPAIKKDNPAEGLRDTFIEIFKSSVANNFDNALVFEDDVKFVELPDWVMNGVIDQLPKDYDMVYMGLNPFGGFNRVYSENLLEVKAACTTHACVYSKRFMQDVLETNIKAPIDMHFAEFHRRGKSYATYPLLCVQRAGFSYIEGKEVDYSKFIQERYAEKIKEI
jgi:hypothetical protein